MTFARSCGILLHPTSLPAKGGIGNLGQSARRFVDFLTETGQTWWQMLPVGPTGYGNSPYQSPSSFAGNWLLIDLSSDDLLEATRGETRTRVASDDAGPDDALPDEGLQGDLQRVDYARMIPVKRAALWNAVKRLRNRERDEGFEEFRERERDWLDDFSLFSALKGHFGESSWTKWPEPIRSRDATALGEARAALREEVEREQYVQYLFERNWRSLQQYAHSRGIKFLGDLPIFCAHDSADVWSRRDLFRLDERGEPTVVAGVPPDYFSALGQRWGNPLYDWAAHEQEGFAWWTARLERMLRLFDAIRIDHFRGFESHWEIPAGAADARPGHWVPAPGAALFQSVERRLGKLPVIAEDLGVITPPVEALRDELGFPGLRVLQFAFGDDPKGPDYRPHRFPRNCVVYTGTHDNNTTVGWFQESGASDSTRSLEQIERERETTLAYLGTEGTEIHWDMIRAAWASVADVAIAPMQDILGLGAEARMNQPGTASGNWEWRFRESQLTEDVIDRLRGFTNLYERGRPPGQGDA